MLTFFTINPYISCAYFVIVLIFSMVFMHPIFVLLNVILSFAGAMRLAGQQTKASFKYTIAFGLIIAFINPLFNSGGETVLFTFFGRNYTLQALVYGFIMAGILVSCINWFSCFGRIITADKLMYIMGGRLPNVSTILTMTIGLVPFFQNKLSEISRVQNTVIKSESNTKSAFRALNAATSYAFEHAVSLSVSMKNRGYASGRATRYARYNINMSDILLLIIIILLTAGTAWGAFSAAVGAEIIPVIVLPHTGTKEFLGGICYVALLLMPATTKIIEEIQWQYLKSKI